MIKLEKLSGVTYLPAQYLEYDESLMAVDSGGYIDDFLAEELPF